MPCSAWTNKLITAKDHASVQINIGHLNEDGVYTNQFTTFALAGKVRAQVRPGKRPGSVQGARGSGDCGSGTQSSEQYTLQAAGESRRQQEAAGDSCPPRSGNGPDVGRSRRQLAFTQQQPQQQRCVPWRWLNGCQARCAVSCAAGAAAVYSLHVARNVQLPQWQPASTTPSAGDSHPWAWPLPTTAAVLWNAEIAPLWGVAADETRR